MDQWNRNTVPKCIYCNGSESDEVLVTVEQIRDDGKLYRRVIKAVYSLYGSAHWYEVCDYEDYSYTEIPDHVIAWMELPKPCEPS